MLIRASEEAESGHPVGKDRADESNPDAEDVIGGFPQRVAFERRRPEVRAEKRVGEPKGGRQPVVHEDGRHGMVPECIILEPAVEAAVEFGAASR